MICKSDENKKLLSTVFPRDRRANATPADRVQFAVASAEWHVEKRKKGNEDGAAGRKKSRRGRGGQMGGPVSTSPSGIETTIEARDAGAR